MPSMILAAGEQWVTGIGNYTCEPQNVSRLEALIQSYYTDRSHDLPGLVGTAIHRRLEGNGILSLSQWESSEVMLDAIRDIKVHPDLIAARGIAKVDYQAVRTIFTVMPKSRQRRPILDASGIVVGDKCCSTSLTIATHSPDHADDILLQYREIHETTMRNINGFEGAALLQSVDRGTTFSYGQWADANLVEEALKLPRYKEALATLARLATYDRHWFQSVVAVKLPKHRRLL